MNKFFIVLLVVLCAGCTQFPLASKENYPAGGGQLTDATGNPIVIEELVQ